jgi:hypothetical protein
LIECFVHLIPDNKRQASETMEAAIDPEDTIDLIAAAKND